MVCRLFCRTGVLDTMQSCRITTHATCVSCKTAGRTEMKNTRAHWLVAICETELVGRSKVFRICCDHKQVLQFLDVRVEITSKERILVAAAPEP